MNGRRPVLDLLSVSRAEMMADELNLAKKGEDSNPELNYGLGIAKVVEIDYVEFLVTLQVLIGASGSMPRIPVPLTMPGAGSRHILGIMPEIGDMCVVGWMPQESGSSTNKTPVILSWVVNGVWPGYNWVTTSNFTHDEADLGSKYLRDAVRGALDRVRHKLPNLQPGNGVMSSKQGSDLILSEDVYISNRRGGDILIRDADNAIILRAGQKFEAFSGIRSYSGLVQRDSLLLNPQIISNGLDYNAPFDENELPTSNTTSGKLEPAFVFDGSNLNISDNLDPYTFMRKGSFIDDSGYMVSEQSVPSYLYGGKPVYRVSANNGNAANSNVPTFTEFGFEINEFDNATLPVTEQTDLYDFDGVKKKRYISFYTGTVVGNDPFSAEGRSQYGKPLTATIFEGASQAPRINSANIAVNGGDVSTDKEDYLSLLYKMNPPNGDRPAFFGLNKKGQLKIALSGKNNENSLEAALQGGLKLSVNGDVEFLFNKNFILGTKGKSTLNLRSENAPVVIYGGASKKSTADRLITGKESDTPAVDIGAKTNIYIHADKKTRIESPNIELSATRLDISSQQNIQIKAASRISFQTESLDMLSSGKTTQNFSGPPLFLPTFGAIHERNYIPAFPGLDCENVTYAWGNRNERFLLGNHDTHILIGNATYQTDVGTILLRSATNTLSVYPAGINGSATGNVTLTAVGGVATLSGTASVVVNSEAGLATVRGTAGLYLGGPVLGPDVGPIICAGSLDPFSGLPFGTFGIGAKGHIVGV